MEQDMDEKIYDVLVVGAGAAGMIAARELTLAGKRTALLEGRDRLGGRIQTFHHPHFEIPVELGAEFVHGDLELTTSLLKSAGASLYKVTGEIWQNEDGKVDQQTDFVEDFSLLKKKFKALKEDISVADFLENHLQEPGS